MRFIKCKAHRGSCHQFPCDLLFPENKIKENGHILYNLSKMIQDLVMDETSLETPTMHCTRCHIVRCRVALQAFNEKYELFS